MRLIKHQSDDVKDFIIQEGHERISSETAFFLNAKMKLNLDIKTEGGDVDMCLAQERNNQRQRIEASIEVYREYGESDEAIIDKIMKKFNVAREFVLTFLAPQTNE